MKRIRIITAMVVVLAFSGILNAQEKALKQYGFWDNWFIQPQVGVSYTTGEVGFGNLLSPSAALSAGKYFSPEVGTRLQLSGWRAKGGMREGPNYNWNYMATTVDVLFNLNNIFAPYKEDRPFNLVALMGGGWNHGFKNKPKVTESTDNIVVRAGLQANFRLNSMFDLNLEGNINATDDVWNHKSGSKYDTYYNVLLGLTYRFKNRGFELVETSNEALIRALNEKINEQREIINNIRPYVEPEPCPEPEPAVVKKGETAVVLFRIGKSMVIADQAVHIYKIAEYMKENPEATVQVTGYADAQTGTPAVNKAISEKRAQAVTHKLKEYGIAESRIKTESRGAEEQPFEVNEWNRVVILFAE
ncbi:MAG: OmpA family protein [Bacteroides sp.]|nr:OmpA family protein [Bacteroides sp.]